MADSNFPNNVDGWLVGGRGNGSSDHGAFNNVGSSPQGHHRIAYRFISDNGKTLTYRIYHQFALGLTSHIMNGYGVKYTYTINGTSKTITFKDSNYIWNSGPNGEKATQSAKVHYYNDNASSGQYAYKLHSYTDTDRLGSSTTKTWNETDITFNKSKSGVVSVSMSWADVGVLGAPSSMEFSFGGKSIDTGRPSYGEPTDYSLTFPEIVRDDKTTNMTYSIQCGTSGEIDWIDYEVYPGTTRWSYGKWDNVSSIAGSRLKSTRFYAYNGSGNRPTSKSGQQGISLGVGSGKAYRLAIHFSDCWHQWISGDDDYFRTYTKPTISASISKTKFSPQDEPKVTWETNCRTWCASNREDNFVTTATMNGSNISNVSQNPTNSTDGSSYSSTSGNSITINASLLNDKYSASERSVKTLSGSIKLNRSNTKAGTDYDASSTPTFTVQYQPVLAPTSVSIKSGGSSLPVTLIIQDKPTINMSWGYQLNSGAAGVVSGYYVEIFTTSDYSGTPYRTFVVNGSSSASKDLSSANDLKRGKMNYVKITPFYKCPDTTKTADYIDVNHNIRGTQSYTAQLCKPVSRINTPVISYPINNSTWHNKYFRVLLQLPEDPDLDYLVADREITSADAYRYKEIQFEITYPDSSTKTYTTSTTAVWSTSVFSHKRKIAICPALSALNDVATYKMRIRVQKNYYSITGDDSWSNWSSYVIVKKKAVTRQTYTKGQKVMASHYMNPRTASVNCHGVYPIHSLPANNLERSAGQKIEHKHYKAIYDTISQIKTDVNGYCTYDNANVSFTRDITNFTTNPPKVEYITAADTDSIKTANDGRNYMNLLVDDLNLLY